VGPRLNSLLEAHRDSRSGRAGSSVQRRSRSVPCIRARLQSCRKSHSKDFRAGSEVQKRRLRRWSWRPALPEQLTWWRFQRSV